MQSHVLFISSWYPSPHNKTHGIFVKRCAEAVALQNKVSVIYAYGHESFSDEIKIESRTENNVFEVFVYFKKKKNNPLTKFVNYKKHYLKGLDYLIEKAGRPDLLQVNVAFPAGIAGLKISKKLQIPFVLAEHWTGYHPEDGSYKGFLKRYFTKKTVQAAARIVTVTENLKKAMMAHGLNGHYSVIPNVVNTQVFNCQPAAGIKFRFLHVSSLDPLQKNVKGILSAFKKLNQQHPDTELVIVGGGESRAHLEQKAGDLLNRSVFFHGQKLDKELALEFNRANVLVLFSNYENLPVVILEALCCGVPVISSDVGGIREFVKNEHGQFVKPGDETALQETMQRMIAENKNYNREAISSYSRGLFSAEHVGHMYTRIYKAVLKK